MTSNLQAACEFVKNVFLECRFQTSNSIAFPIKQCYFNQSVAPNMGSGGNIWASILVLCSCTSTECCVFLISSRARPPSVCRLHVLAIICIGSLWVFLVGNTYKSMHVYLSDRVKAAATAEQIKWKASVTRCCTVGQWDVPLLLQDGWMQRTNFPPLRGPSDGRNCVTASVDHIRRSTKEALRGRRATHHPLNSKRQQCKCTVQ